MAGETRALAEFATGLRYEDDGRSVAIDDSRLDDDDAGGLDQRIEQKFRNLTADLPDDWRVAVLRRLQSIESENLAEIFVR